MNPEFILKGSVRKTQKRKITIVELINLIYDN